MAATGAGYRLLCEYTLVYIVVVAVLLVVVGPTGPTTTNSTATITLQW